MSEHPYERRKKETAAANAAAKEAAAAAVAAPSSSAGGAPAAASSSQMTAVMRLMNGMQERTIAEKMADANRPTWEQYKKENEDKLDLKGAELKKMQQYRAELDAVREAELQRREVAKGPKVKTDAAISDDDRKAKKERKKKKKRKHDSDEDSDERKERKRQKKERKRQKKEAKKAKKKESEPVRLSDFLRGGGSSSDSD